MSAAIWSRGWGSSVQLGDGQERMRRELERGIKNPSRSWHEVRMRGFDRSSSTAHRLIHRLAALGVIAVQTTLGAHGGTRFTFGVRHWHRGYIRRRQLVRMRLSPGQLMIGLAEERARISRGPAASSPPERAVSPPAGTFGELMARAGFSPWWAK